MDAPPPYFDALFDRLAAGDPAATAAFGRHVHWGYWPDPDAADGSAEDYAQAAEELCRRVCDAAPVSDGMRVLDVGCGFGGTVASLNERFRSLDMVGVNIDPRQLARAADIVTPVNGNRVEWVRGDACDLPLGSLFDVVLAVECAFHFPSRAKFLHEAARVLRPGGRLAVSDFLPTADGLPYLRDATAAGHADTLRGYGKVDVLCDADEYRRLAGAAGFGDFAHADVTPHTMPTYPFLRRTANTWRRGAGGAYLAATRRLEVASRGGWLRYEILSATKGWETWRGGDKETRRGG
jgi:SAM-dependent methyltransferase